MALGSSSAVKKSSRSSKAGVQLLVFSKLASTLSLLLLVLLFISQQRFWNWLAMGLEIARTLGLLRDVAIWCDDELSKLWGKATIPDGAE